MERFDYDRWKRETEIEQRGLWDEVDQLKWQALVAEEEKKQCRVKEEQRAQRLGRLEAIMSRVEPDEGENGEMREPSWVQRGSNVSLGRRPSIQAAQRELDSARMLRPRWKAGTAVSQYRAQRPTRCLCPQLTNFALVKLEVMQLARPNHLPSTRISTFWLEKGDSRNRLTLVPPRGFHTSRVSFFAS